MQANDEKCIQMMKKSILSWFCAKNYPVEEKVIHKKWTKNTATSASDSFMM